MIAEVRLLIATEANPAEIEGRLPTAISKALRGTEAVIVTIDSIDMTWPQWAERKIREEGRAMEEAASESDI
ncbi:hypothetical protein [Methanomassiliicoccus luminyensis]|uniref:hypothetical protein n=1 Tax=Methanomassiliicoccus luminyensis TaxID=1080712 RepID=UPI00037D8BA9|nr:hypothetical protein [Methanomassiliicoccus luminyensis]